MAPKAIFITAFAVLAAAIPQHAEHIGKAQLARSNQLFSRDLTERTVSQDGSCGPSANGLTCPSGTCCSSAGWCGSTPLHCGGGCQSAFGVCTSGSSDNTTPVVVVPSGGNSPQEPVDNQPQQQATTTTWNAAPTTTATTAPAATTTAASSGSSSGLGDVYKLYTGDGSEAAGWPAQSSWADFETLFANNKPLMQQSCTQFGAADNSDDEIASIKTALQSAASQYNVDARFLLAIMMQESGGCVRAPTTNYGVRNPGLFQSHNGKYTCNEGTVSNPCPASSIQGMINDGTDGTSYLGSGVGGDGLLQTIAESGRSDVSMYYRAARIYNSGSIASSGQLQDGIATHCYSSDVANRLTGWVHAAHGCSQ